jgi:uncharacterized protein (TIGR02266 family)
MTEAIKLRLTHPAIGQRIFAVGAQGVALGRAGGGVDVELNWDVLVSRRHARVWVEQGQLWFTDLESRNGSWLGAQRLRDPLRFSDNAAVVIGDTVLRLADPMLAVDDVIESALGIEDIPTKTYAGLALPPRAEEEPIATVDLREPVLEPRKRIPTADLELPPPPAREHPRFVTPNQVQVSVREKSELRALWVENISKGGLFVRTDRPPAWGTRVEVVLDAGRSRLPLQAKVVHIVDGVMARRMNLQAGVGLQFVDLTADKRELIHRYVEGITKTLGAERSEVQELVGARDRDELMRAARHLLAQSDENDLYGAIEVEPTASGEQINAKIWELRRGFSDPGEGTTPQQKTRLDAAIRCLERIATLFSDPTRRLEYDFRTGHVRAKERLTLARGRNGVPVSRLWEVWARAFPGHIERAATLSRQALEARQRRDFQAAVRHGRQALDLNPFIEELWSTVEAWEQMLKG